MTKKEKGEILEWIEKYVYIEDTSVMRMVYPEDRWYPNKEYPIGSFRRHPEIATVTYVGLDKLLEIVGINEDI